MERPLAEVRPFGPIMFEQNSMPRPEPPEAGRRERRSKEDMLRLADLELSNELTNKFFEDAAFFKKELYTSNEAIIPKDEVEALGISPGDEVNVLFMGLENGEVLLNKSKSSRTGSSSLYITIPKDCFEELDSNNEFVQIVLSKHNNSQSLLPSGGIDFAERIMSIGGINFFEATMLYKARIYKRGEDDGFNISLPKRETKYMSLSHEQPINVSIIELDSGKRITIKDRSKFRVEARNVKRSLGEKSFRFTIPVKRARMRGYKEEQLVQVIARPARLDV